ncbi:hypothetical protein [Candidatus Kuenenia stuttgartiensis]|uniref:hypothetical protein n=1 Tax=Kuenenia stuttgartiensis TaxID=174633 RepID=UPI00146CE881|nr:hypothetical protein [Candidatus Kuenenia stuttgartiensis]
MKAGTYHVQWLIPQDDIIVLSLKKLRHSQCAGIASSRINDLSLAKENTDNDVADACVCWRGRYCRPGVAQQNQQGRYDDIRTCIACQSGCFLIAANFKGVPAIYMQWPDEGEYAGTKRKV